MEFRQPQDFYSIIFDKSNKELLVGLPKDIREFWSNNKQFWFSHKSIDTWEMEIVKYSDNPDINFRLILYYDQLVRHPTTHKNVKNVNNYTFATQMALHIINTNQYNYLEDHEKVFTLLALRHNNNINLKYLVLNKLKCHLDRDNINKSLLLRFIKATIQDIDKYKRDNFLFKKEELRETMDLYYSTAKCVIDFEKYSENNYIFRDLYGKFLITVEKYITPEEKCVSISLSGGVDSMVLSYFMNIICKKHGIILKLLHINYNNRDTCQNEIALLKYWAIKLDCPLYIREIDEITRIKSRNSTLRQLYEDVTKSIRMNFYKYHASKIFNGHNYEDTLENVFANLAKNKNYDNLRGMRDIAEISGNTIVRPLLKIKKDEIYAMAEALNIPHLINSTPEWSFRGRTREILMDSIQSFDNRILPGLDILVSQHTFLMKQWNIMFDLWFQTGQNENKIQINPGNTKIERSKLDTFLESNISNKEFWIRLWEALSLGSFPSSKSISYLIQGIKEGNFNKYTINPKIYVINNAKYLMISS